LPSRLVACGRFLKAFGVRGELKFEPYLPDDISPEDISGGEFRRGGESKEITIISGRVAGNLWILLPGGVKSPEGAAMLTNGELWVDRSVMRRLPDGQYLRQDVMGCRVYDEEDVLLGEVNRIISTGANDVWQIARAGGGELLLPVIDDVIIAVDVEERRIIVRVPEGLEE